MAAMQHDADRLFEAGSYRSALAEFSVLRERRARHEGPYSRMYLANLHDALRCMGHLELWADSLPLGRELYGKYLRTHGPARPDTVDAAKRYAWALVCADSLDPAVAIYLTTADALWPSTASDGSANDSPDQLPEATRLLGAAVVHHHNGHHDVLDLAAASTSALSHVEELRRVADTLPVDAVVGIDGAVLEPHHTH